MSLTPSNIMSTILCDCNSLTFGHYLCNLKTLSNNNVTYIALKHCFSFVNKINKQLIDREIGEDT